MSQNPHPWNRKTLTTSEFIPEVRLPSDDEPAEQRQSRLISRVLSPAVRLWVRSQVEHIDDLHFTITGGDRQLLSGHIPQVAVSARKAVYQGLHVSQIQLNATDIRINLGQVVRGKPLRLLDRFPVQGSLCLDEGDLNASLQAPLLANALSDLLSMFLQSVLGQDTLTAVLPGFVAKENREPLPDSFLIRQSNQWKATLDSERLYLSGTLTAFDLKHFFKLELGLQLVSPHELQISDPIWFINADPNQPYPLRELNGFLIDLGTDVDLQELKLEDKQVICRGTMAVIPE